MFWAWYQVEGQGAKRRLVDGFTTTYKIHGLKPNTLVQGILVRGRTEFGWGPAILPALSGRSSAAPPAQVQSTLHFSMNGTQDAPTG